MEILLHAIEGVFSLLLIGLMGYTMAARGWFSEETKAILPKLVTLASLPLYLMSNLVTTFHRDDLLHVISGVIVPALSMLLCFIISWIFVKLFKVEKKHEGAFKAAFSTSNSIFIGIPVNIALFGEESLPYVLLYFFANTTFFWSIGNYCISSDRPGKKVQIFSVDMMKKIFSMPTIGFLLGLVFVMLNVQLPDFLLKTARYMGSMTTPLAIIFIGVTLFYVDLKKIRLNKDILLVIFGRFIISPLSIIAICYFIPIPELMRKVFIIQASLPVMAQLAIMTAFYKVDAEYGAIVVSLTTLLSIVTIPICMVLIS